MRVDKVTSGDGAVVTVYSTGAGPGIVILHGGGVGQRESTGGWRTRWPSASRCTCTTVAAGRTRRR